MARDAIEQRILTRIDELSVKGYGALSTHQPNPPGTLGFPTLDAEAFNEWRTQSLSFLEGFLGTGHVYTLNFKERVEQGYEDHVKAGQGILRAVRDDVANGYLATVRELIHADVFTDFLEMADYLLAEGYKDPAAMLAGGVLEEHLRQLCKKHGVDTEMQIGGGLRPKKAESMNADLSKAGVYSVLEQKNVTAWLDLRNRAAHAKYEGYTEEQVRQFVRALPDFMVRNPA